MDTAKAFKPGTILLWRGVADDPEAHRIIETFPEAEVRVVEKQRGVPLPPCRGKHPIVAGKRVLMIGAATSFVHHFDGCLGGNISCAPYLKLVPVSNGCPYYCTYCYLAYVYREHLPLIKVNINHAKMLREIREVALTASGVTCFNMGEMLDSLALDHITHLTQRLVPYFSHMKDSYLMLLTKSANVDGLLEIAPDHRTVVSWSLNTRSIVETYEPGTAGLEERFHAARRCQERGYRIRLRIDPGILCPGWQAEYAELIEKGLSVLEPENITLGMLRFLPGHLRLARQMYGRHGQKLQSMVLTHRGSDWKLRYAPEQRIDFYRFLIDVIRACDKRVSIGLCRETMDVWSGLHDLCRPGQCNCLIWA